MAATILLIDDDPTILHLLKLFLENEGYHVWAAQSGAVGLEIAARQLPDLAIVDIMMPVMDGFEACRQLREIGLNCILAMSHRHDERCVVKALESGADDYLRKPFEVPVLAARVRTLLRRDGRDITSGSSVYNDGRLLIDLDRRYVAVRGRPVQLTPTEFRLLSTLLHNLGRVVSHEELLREVWGMADTASLVSLKVYVHYLRRKIEDHPRKPRYLLAEWGVGYRFREPAALMQPSH